MTPNRRAPRTIAALFVAVALAFPAAAQTNRTSANRVSIDNFGRISANYFRGAQPQGGDYADLRGLGVKTIIDLTQDGDVSEAGVVKGLGMRFFRIPMTTRLTPTAQQIQQFLTIVNDPANQPVYVHCQGGRHRTGVMTAIYRMTADGWNADRAFAEMKRFKFGADFLHPEFKRFVYAYHAEPKAAPPTIVATTVPAK
jgi:tyrosine-protein phosphatase SIW14